MDKIDYKKALKRLYAAAAGVPVLVDVPPMNFLVIDGQGDPATSQEYRDSVEALYTVSYTLKFAIKKARDIDYGVMPLEGLWWADDMKSFLLGERSKWKWTSMIMQPEIVTLDHVAKSIAEAAKKKKLPALDKVRFQKFSEGRAAQVLHIGPYSAEGPTIEKLHQFIREKGFQLAGKHHEIYLGDPRKAAPDKLKTIVRQPYQ